MRKLIPPSIKRCIKNNMIAGPEFVPEKNDLMLVSYPKSGNTWLKSLLFNTVFGDSSLSEVEKKIPDIYARTNKEIGETERFPFGGRVVKSHEAYKPFYKKAIYIYRDPRDVMISYYHYIKKRGLKGSDVKSLKEFSIPFVDGSLDNFGNWNQNVKSWVAMSEADILLCSYEDFRKDTYTELKRVLAFSNIEYTSSLIEKTIEASSLESLRNKELKEGKGWREAGGMQSSVNSPVSFFRSGKDKQWLEYERSTFNEIEKRWGDLMEKLGYEI